MTSKSAIRQNYNGDCEALVNKHANMELYASYLYTSLSFHFDRSDISSHGYSQFFKKMSTKKSSAAHEFLKYQNKRGGRVCFQDISTPPVEWKTPDDALQESLEIEKRINAHLIALKSTADANKDAHLEHFLDGHIDSVVECINTFGHLITNLKRCGTGLGGYQFDHLTMEKM
ncbi:ferritin heavy chain A-like [Clytia hemisphaerica]|uniref:Ferritin n=1 Tax=Clytia hemisphaerica TaxID=252671 RepID=A0A7M5WJI5_9CNID|eukprot:TCONS_00002260-protein